MRFLAWPVVAATAAAALLVAAGCSQERSVETRPQTTGASEAVLAGGAPATVRPASAIPRGRRVLALFGLGRLEWRCDGRRFATTWLPESATQRVAVALGGGRPSRFTIHPGTGVATALRRVRVVRWVIVQDTKPQLIRATLRVRPSVCPYGFPQTEISVRSVPH